MKFTQAWVNRVKYAGKQAEYFDRGLVLGVNKRGKVWKAKHDVRDATGKLRTVKTVIGDVANMTLREARIAREATVNAQAAKMSQPQSYRGYTVQACVNEYGRFLREKGRSRRTIEQFETNFARYLDHWLDRKASSITDHQARAMHEKLTRKRGARTANAVMQSVRSLYNHMHKLSKADFHADSNPTSGVFWHTHNTRDDVVDDLPAWWTATDAMEDERRAYHQIMLLTGLRKNTMLQLKWAMFQNGWLEIPGRLMKSGRNVRVPLSSQASAILRKLTPCSDFIFPRSTPYREKDLVVGHALRRTYYTTALGIAPQAIVELLCDHTPRDPVAKHYTNLAKLDDKLMKATQEISDELRK